MVAILLMSDAVALAGFGVAGRREQRVRYRPDRWHAPEVVVALSGVSVAVVLFLSSELDPATLDPSLVTVTWPTVAWLPLAGVLLGLIPAFLTPLPEPPYASFDDEAPPAAPIDLGAAA